MQGRRGERRKTKDSATPVSWLLFPSRAGLKACDIIFPLSSITQSTSLGHMTVNLNYSREENLTPGRSALAPHVRVRAEAGNGVVLALWSKVET